MALCLQGQYKQIGTSVFYVVQDKDRLTLGDQHYGYKMLMYLLCTVPTELWARLACLDTGHNLFTGLVESTPQKKRKKKEKRVCVLFALERRAFRLNKLEKWQTLYNEELPEKTHSAPEFTWWINVAWNNRPLWQINRLFYLYSTRHS